MAVYTHVARDELLAFLADHELGALEACEPIAAGVSNSNYRLTTARGRFILTLYEHRVADEDLPFFLGLMDHLAARDVPCPRPVRDRRGEALGRLAGRPAAIVTFLDGAPAVRTTAGHLKALGASLAGLHAAGQGYPRQRPNALSVSGWRPLIKAAGLRADDVSPGLAARVSEEFERLAAAWPQDLPSGVVHADLFPDNVFFEGESVSGIIDFYFACQDAFAYDFAICLNAWCFEPEPRAGGETAWTYRPELGAAMAEGYEGVRRLEAAERAALPTLARGAAFRFLLTRLVDWLDVPAGALVKPLDPREYLAKLDAHARLETAADYGVGR